MLEKKDVKVRDMIVRDIKVEVCRECGYTKITDEGFEEVKREYNKRYGYEERDFWRYLRMSSVGFMGYMSLDSHKEISLDEIEIYDEDEEIRKELEKYQIVSHVKEVVEQKGILISSIAKRLGVTPQRVYAIIKGEKIPTLENAFKLVKVLGVEKVEDLYEFKKIE
jgi:DNA-binding XRE family transcriptional regulator